MLRVVTPGGHITTVQITHNTWPSEHGPAQPVTVGAASIISVAHVSSAPGDTIFLQTGQTSSGSTALAYTLHNGSLLPSGAVLGYGGDSGAQAGFQCLAGNPRRLIQHTYELVGGIKAIGHSIHIYGVWKVTTTRYDWNGTRLARVAQHTATRRPTPTDTVALSAQGRTRRADPWSPVVMSVRVRDDRSLRGVAPVPMIGFRRLRVRPIRRVHVRVWC